MEHPVISGTAHDASGTAFTVVAISNTPTTDWAEVFRALANTDLTPQGSAAPGRHRAPGTRPPTAGAPAPPPRAHRA